jgi:16S rRNA (guanine527-N7)-methyltransferase
MRDVSIPDGPQRLEAFGVSRETRDRFATYVSLLQRWQKMMNLVSPATLDQIWSRHVADSIQIFELAPLVRHWVDLGSGGGFPGMVTAIRLAEVGAGQVILMESDKRKCSFLREVIRETGARAEVVAGRIEVELAHFESPIEAFSARALASLPVLLDYVEPHLQKGAKAFFLKGKDVQKELTEVPDLFRYSYRIWPSRIQADGSIVEFSIEPGKKPRMDDA